MAPAVILISTTISNPEVRFTEDSELTATDDAKMPRKMRLVMQELTSERRLRCVELGNFNRGFCTFSPRADRLRAYNPVADG